MNTGGSHFPRLSQKYREVHENSYEMVSLRNAERMPYFGFALVMDVQGDKVFMYVGSPVSAILYKCKVTETGIPYHGHHEEINIKALMKIRLQKRFPADRFTFEVLKSEYGIYAVRGPRGIPNSLSAALKR